MLFEIEKEKLLEAFKFASLGLERTSFDPTGKSIYFKSVNDNLVIITKSDLITTKTTINSVKIHNGFEFVVDKFIIEILGKNKADILKFKEQKHKIIVTSTNGSNSFSTIEGLEFIDNTPPDTNYYLVEDKKEFCQMFKTLTHCLSNANDQPILKTYFISPPTETMISSDGTKIMRIVNEEIKYFGEVSNSEGTLLNPLISLFNSLENKDELKVSFGKINSFMVKTDNLLSEIKMQSDLGEYPPSLNNITDNLLKEPPLITLTVKNSNLKEIIQQAVMYCDIAINQGTPHQTIMNISNDEVRLHMSIKDLSEMDRILECEKQGGEDKILFLSKNMLGALNVMGENLELRFFERGGLKNNDPTPFLILDKDNPSIVYLQAQMYEV